VTNSSVTRSLPNTCVRNWFANKETGHGLEMPVAGQLQTDQLEGHLEAKLDLTRSTRRKDT
jgi:hypothetical protein